MFSMKNNVLLQWVLGIVGLSLFVFLGIQSMNAWKQSSYIGRSQRDTILIDGEGKVTATPDIARVSVGVMTEGQTVKDVQRQNTEKMNAITGAMKELGIAEKDLQTSNYSISPKYDYTNGAQRLAGYIVSQNIEIKVRNMDSVGPVLQKAGELGANQVGGVQFSIDDPQSLQQQARIKAVEDARRKAEDLGKQLGLTIVRVVTFTESGGSRPPMYAPMAMMKSYDQGVAASAPSPEVQSGSLDVTSSVTVTFEVR